MRHDKEQILELTDRAYKHIRSLMEKYGKKSQLRLSVQRTGCSGYMYRPEIVDCPQKGDVFFKTKIGLVISIDSRCIPFVRGTVVDYVKKGFGQYQLHFNNPNAIGSCGCGESFHLKERLIDDDKKT
ncbi:iron-sulfur cluster assembly accessory protein [Coxiella endosymbiont of Amblyomma sculptum]|uniref:iron-sulfur cluster assembly accessory protein n=1 Tax=Coxiella endosymbiont of Amblyomma sculptum TaxID=2487929 RepID=UPI00132F2782|nr:iron-sulfur cluster assembly accessory protein [Coxiella endosymbiont of Amblyomma sculptum]QHG92531.1 iron-sulfur cluster assembly accessory protein [Coxiella endosymbiont of Amblyomma sculptum]